MAERGRAPVLRAHSRPRGLGWAAAVAVADGLVVGALLLHGVHDPGTVVRAGLLGLGAVLLAVLAGWIATLAGAPPRTGRAAGPPPEPERPAGLEELQRLVDGCRAGIADRAQFDERLRPLLLQLAVSRLGGHPVPQERLRARLDTPTATLLLTGSGRPSAGTGAAGTGAAGTGGVGGLRAGRGPTLAELEQAIAALEAL